MLSKKYYIQIAKILAKNHLSQTKILNDFIGYFKEDNKLFDTDIFLKCFYENLKEAE